MKECDDLFRRLHAGDEKALDAMIRDYFAGLVRFIDRYLHDTPAAEDVAMDVFFEVMTHPSRYNGTSSVKTYLCMIGRSRALTYLRRHAMTVVTDVEEMVGFAATECVETVPESAERDAAVRDAVAKLPAAMQEAVRLVYFEEFSYKEAAAVMKKTEKQVDNLLYRAKAMLRDTLKKGGWQP